MDVKKYKPILEIVLLAIPLFIIHKIIFSFSSLAKTTLMFQYTLEQLYGFFLIASVLIIFALIKIKEKNLDNVGYAFMLLTCIKMAVSYFVVKPILHSASESQHSEKFNFFFIFMLFLAIETMITVRLLNNKQ